MKPIKMSKLPKNQIAFTTFQVREIHDLIMFMQKHHPTYIISAGLRKKILEERLKNDIPFH